MRWYQKRWILGVIGVAIIAAVPLGYRFRFSLLAMMKMRHSVEERLEQYGPAARARLQSAFAGRAPFPPKEAVIYVDKAAKKVELFVPTNRDFFLSRDWMKAMEYPALALSGGPGPKLREGDNQVPEGVYAVEYLNANSAFHLSLRLNYPNEYDTRQAASDKRSDLGTDIMIHGAGGSRGCVCVSDAAIEDLFVLAATIGKENVRVVIVPEEAAVLSTPVRVPPGAPAWTQNLYLALGEAVKELRGIH